MSQRPTTFGQLLARITPPRSDTAKHGGTLIATATEATPNSAENKSSLWVILHSITDSDVRLIHPRPLTAGELAVQIPVVSGEILRVTLAMADSQKNGDLYESTAQFLR